MMNKTKFIQSLKFLKKELHTLFANTPELKFSLRAQILHRAIVLILMLISFVFLGYNCIPDIPLQETTDVAVRGNAENVLDWKTLVIISGVVLGIACVGAAGYYLYHHPELVGTVFRPWRWFSPKTDPKTDPKPDDEQNQDQDQNQNQDQDTATTTTTTDESDSTPEATWTEETSTTDTQTESQTETTQATATASTTETETTQATATASTSTSNRIVKFSRDSIFYGKESDFGNLTAVTGAHLEKICHDSIIYVLSSELSLKDLGNQKLTENIKMKVYQRAILEINELLTMLNAQASTGLIQEKLVHTLKGILVDPDHRKYFFYMAMERYRNIINKEFPGTFRK